MCWFYVVSLLNKREVDTYDSRCKKSSKVFKRVCKIDIWNKRIKNLGTEQNFCLSNICSVLKFETKKELMLFLLYHLLNI